VGSGALVAAACFACSNAAALTQGGGRANPDPRVAFVGSELRGPAVNACVTTSSEVCLNARDDNCNGLLDEGCGVPSGLVQFMVAWERADADVDLHVTDPEGELVEVGRVTKSGLTKERDCPGKGNVCGPWNLENVLQERSSPLKRGVYVVRIRLERSSNTEDPVEVNFSARLGPKTYGAEVELLTVSDERRFELQL
jgi:tRNA (guanosine-2'-O-)-methyltransferase